MHSLDLEVQLFPVFGEASESQDKRFERKFEDNSPANHPPAGRLTPER